MSNDLVERLLAVIGETERIAKDAAGVPWVDDVPGMVQVDSTVIRDNKIAYGHLGYVAGTDPTPLGDAYRKHIVRQDPDSVLRRCVADRRIVELHAGDHECREMHTGVYPPDWPATAAYGKPGETWRHACTECFEGKPCDTLKALAEGYGVSVEEP